MLTDTCIKFIFQQQESEVEGIQSETSATEAQGFTPARFIAGSSWLSSTTVNYSFLQEC